MMGDLTMQIQFDTTEIKKVYPQYEAKKDYYNNRIQSVVDSFVKQYEFSDKLRLFSAPGRIEIGGNHTDHQNGCVLAAAIDLDVLGVARKTENKIVRIYSENYGLIMLDISDLSVKEEEENTTYALVRGVYKRIIDLGFEVHGIDIYCTSNVLGGSGLSSSAAFEVFLATALNALYCNDKISTVEIAKISQYAENVFFGKPCGLMDQMASAVGNVIAIDFKDIQQPIITQVEFSSNEIGHAICIIDSGADHADLTDEYAAITVEMAQVSKFFGKNYLREITKQELLNNAKEICKQTSDRAFLRALHFQNESERATLEAKALKEKDYASFLRLVTESGFSSFMYLQNIFSTKDIHNQKVAVTLALCQEYLEGKGAFRVHGGGFAGTVQAFVPFDMLEIFKEKIEFVLGKDTCHILSIRELGGTEIK